MSGVPSGTSSLRIYNENTIRPTNFNGIRKKDALRSVWTRKKTIDYTTKKEWNVDGKLGYVKHIGHSQKDLDSRIVYSDEDGHETSNIRLLWAVIMQPYPPPL